MYPLHSPELTQVFSAQPRGCHRNAFRNPARLLQCSCCRKPDSSDPSAILPSQPATSILHELYLESATGLINVYDWFVAFSEHKGDCGLSREQLIAQFMASLDELVWMGYVKRTLKKTDHVEKLVGG
jgi:origin recognition complex subunit 3